MQISSQSLRYQATRLLGAVGGELIDSPVAQGGLVMGLFGDAVRGFKARHPRGARFIANRLDRTRFAGLPLTVLSLLFVCLAALLLGLAEDVVNSEPIVRLDSAVAAGIAGARTPGLVWAFEWLTHLGDTRTVTGLVILTAIILWFTGRRVSIAGLLLSCVGASLSSVLSKLAFQRVRPLAAVLEETSYSFPSGHSTMAVAYYGYAGYLLIRYAVTARARVGWAIVTLGIVLTIGMSRLVLGVHFVSDVGAGYVLGTLWLILGVIVTELWLVSKGPH